MGDRRQVERLARESLRQGFSVCVDRTNFDAQYISRVVPQSREAETLLRQRSTWIKIARESSAAVWVIVFDTPYDVSISAAGFAHNTDVEVRSVLSVCEVVRAIPYSSEIIKAYNLSRNKSSDYNQCPAR